MLYAERRLTGAGPGSRSQEASSPLIILTQSPIATLPVAFFLVVTLAESDYISSLFSIPALLAYLAIYAPLKLWPSLKSQNHGPSLSLDDDIFPLSLRAISVCIATFVARWLVLVRPWPSLFAVLALGAAKSCLWYSLLMTVRLKPTPFEFSDKY